MVPLRNLGNFWRTIEMSIINYETSLNLTWSETCAIYSATGRTKLLVTDTKNYIPVVPLSTEDKIKLLKQLVSGFNRTIGWNK